MPEFDLKRPFWGKQSVPALPPCSDINLLGNRERIVDLDTKVSDGALHLRVAQEELYCPQTWEGFSRRRTASECSLRSCSTER